MLSFKNIILFLSCTILLLSCQNEKSKTKGIRFPKTYPLHGKSLNVSDILGRTNMFKIKDNQLILKDNNSETLITIIDLENPENYFYLAQIGEGPGELINPSRIFLSEDGFSILDGGKMCLYDFNIHKIEEEGYKPESIFTTKILAIVSLEQFSDTLYIASGIFPDSRFYFINKQGELVAENGSYPFDFESDYPFHVKCMANLSMLVKSPRENKIATSTLYGGHIGVYEIDNHKLTIKTISEIVTFAPEFTTFDYGSTPNFKPTDQTRWGYISIAGDENHIYALYSGKLQKEGEEFYTGSIIHVFNWDGQPAYTITLDNPAYWIDVYQGKLYTLYADDDSAFEIAMYILP